MRSDSSCLAFIHTAVSKLVCLIEDGGVFHGKRKELDDGLEAASEAAVKRKAKSKSKAEVKPKRKEPLTEMEEMFPNHLKPTSRLKTKQKPVYSASRSFLGWAPVAPRPAWFPKSGPGMKNVEPLLWSMSVAQWIFFVRACVKTD